MLLVLHFEYRKRNSYYLHQNEMRYNYCLVHHFSLQFLGMNYQYMLVQYSKLELGMHNV
ncbi:hypothetical protein [Salmonella phage SD-1_S14]|nr:hypothetical protein [Salmonella phage SD-1_S14]